MLRNKTTFPVYNDRDRVFAAKDGDSNLMEFIDFIEQIHESGELETSVEEGIVAKVKNEGTNGLSEKQGFVLQTIVDRYEGNECLICGEKIPLNEVLFENDGLCSYHKNVVDKDD